MFLHEDTDDEKSRFRESNKGFEDCQGEDFRYWMKGEDIFAHVWCKEGDKNILRDVLEAFPSTASFSEISEKIAHAWGTVKPAIDALLARFKEELKEVLVFIHWHGTLGFEGMSRISKVFNTYLKGKYNGGWVSYAVSSDMNTPQNEPIFDVKEPVIPVGNFAEWFGMYKEWLEHDGKLPDGVKYISHKKYGAELNGAKLCGDAPGRKAGVVGSVSNTSVGDMFAGGGNCSTWHLWLGIWTLIISALGLIALSVICICYLVLLLDFVFMPPWHTFWFVIGIIASVITGVIVFAFMIFKLHNRIRRKEILYGKELNVLMISIAKIPDKDLMLRSVGRVVEKVETMILGPLDRD